MMAIVIEACILEDMFAEQTSGIFVDDFEWFLPIT
jgi:hypothetical protein